MSAKAAPIGPLSSRPSCSRPRRSQPPGSGTRRAAGTARPRRRRCAATRRGSRRRSRRISRTRRRGSTSRSSMGRRVRERQGAATRLLFPALPRGVQARGRRPARCEAAEPTRPADTLRHDAVPLPPATRRPGSTPRRISWAVRAPTNLQRSTNQVLGVVMFAAALFVAGRSTKLDAARLRMAMPAIGIAVFVATLAWIATSPVSVLV